MEIVKKIKGRTRGFKFTMLTFQYFSDYTGVEFGDMLEHLAHKTLGSIVTILWAANTVYTKGKNGKISRFDVDDWIAAMSQKDLQDIWDLFEKSVEVLIEQLPKTGEKEKKVNLGNGSRTCSG